MFFLEEPKFLHLRLFCGGVWGGFEEEDEGNVEEKQKETGEENEQMHKIHYVKLFKQRSIIFVTIEVSGWFIGYFRFSRKTSGRVLGVL